jgi:hypothetical protein
MWENPDWAAAECYGRAAGIFRVFKGEEDMDRFLERIHPYPLPKAAVIGIVTPEMDVARAEKFARPGRVEILRVPALTWANAAIAFREFVWRLHSSGECPPYQAGDEFQYEAKETESVVGEPELSLSCAGIGFPASHECLIGKCTLFEKDRHLLQSKEYEVKSDVSVLAFSEFVNAVVGENCDITEEIVDELLLLAKEFGFDDLRRRCMEFTHSLSKSIEAVADETYCDVLDDCESEMNRVDALSETLERKIREAMKDVAEIRARSDAQKANG